MAYHRKTMWYGCLRLAPSKDYNRRARTPTTISAIGWPAGCGWAHPPVDCHGLPLASRRRPSGDTWMRRMRRSTNGSAIIRPSRSIGSWYKTSSRRRRRRRERGSNNFFLESNEFLVEIWVKQTSFWSCRSYRLGGSTLAAVSG